jgi:hypothetical protein
MLLILPVITFADDLDHPVSGDDSVASEIDQSKISSNSPFIINGESADGVESSKAVGEDYTFNHGVKEVSLGKETAKKKYEDFGYTTPGSFANQENYIDLDKEKIAKDLRKGSSGGVNLSFIKNNFNYQSSNDIINRTISTGPKSIKGGALYIRNDSYIAKTEYLNVHWSIGSGVSYSSGKGIFIDGNRSEATFNFWEVPLDIGLGLEFQVSSWFKLAGTLGPSALAVLQNRLDFERGEKGKRKYQISPGYFAVAQFKINLTGFSDQAAHEMFTSSDISNLSMNFELRHQDYSKFQDAISISGTSVGIGFTFEYL